MVQILPEVETFGSAFGRSFGGGFGKGASEGFASSINKKKLAQENKEIFDSTGIDLSSYTDPKMREKAFAAELQGINKERLSPLQESQKSLADERLKALQGQQELFSNLRSGEKIPSMEGERKTFLENMSDSQIDQLSAFAGQPGEMGIAGNIAKSEKDKRERREKLSFEREKLERTEAKELTTPLFKELSTIRKNIPLQEQAIEDIKEASPKIGWRDYFADVLGFEPARTAEGAKLKTGIKDFFLSDLTRAGARPNQWIEQQLADALPKIGRDSKANLITAEGLQFKVDLAKKRLELIDNLSEKDRKKHGYVKADVESRADKEMKKYVIDRQKELKDKIKEIQSKKIDKSKQTYIRMRSPNGEIWDILPEDVDEAIENEFSISE